MISKLATLLQQHFGEQIQRQEVVCNEITVELLPCDLHAVCVNLRDNPDFYFEQLIDVCGVDYLDYAQTEWTTDLATGTGFDRGVQQLELNEQQSLVFKRYAVVYHLLSVTNNHRLRIKVFLDTDNLEIASVTDVWAAANWFERETFDLFGIHFVDHPDLRRILTDYGFIGHPFRKDFPLIGNVEMRYDATLGRVVYEPVSIDPRILVPKVIRDDSRYQDAVIGDEADG